MEATDIDASEGHSSSSYTSPAPSAEESTGETTAPLDLSDLPDLVLERVFKRLSVTDRCRLACCSSRLSALMKRSSSWRDVTLYVDKDDPSSLSRGRIVKGLPTWYWIMIRMYGQYLQNVTVVVSSIYIETRSMEALIELSVRGLLKRLDLRFDNVLSKMVEMKKAGNRPLMGDNSNVDYVKASPCDFLFTETREFSGPQKPYVLYTALEKLSQNVEVSCQFPLHKNSVEPDWEKQPDISNASRFNSHFFYVFAMSQKCHSLFKKLVLCTTPAPEDNLGMVQLSFSTVDLVCSFPNLRELHLDITNLSDELLLDLSHCVLAGLQKPLQRLVIQHGSCEPFTIPQLSPIAWCKLVTASPLLTVECSLVDDKLPDLGGAIHLQTPLTKLGVVSRTADEETIADLFRLCHRHGSTLRHVELFIGTDVVGPDRNPAHLGSVKDIVGVCPGWQHVVLNMCIHDHDLLDLARASRQWRTFRFNPRRVVACQAEEGGPSGDVPASGNRGTVCLLERESTRLADIMSSVQEAVGFSDVVDVRTFTDYLK